MKSSVILNSKFFGLTMFVFLFAFSMNANSMYTEFGANYSYKKSIFDESNYTEQQSAQGSVSFYFMEKLAIEFSYTNGLYVQKEKQPNTLGAVQRTTTVYSDTVGADLIFALMGRQAAIQPFLKAGVAQTKKKQVIQDDNNNPWDINFSGMSPSYGAGIKFMITESFGIRFTYDVIQTPSVNDTKYNESTFRAGISWMP